MNELMNEPWTHFVDLKKSLGWNSPGDYEFDGERYKIFSDDPGSIKGTMGGGWYTIQPLAFQKRHNGHFGPELPNGRREFIKDPSGAYGPPPVIIFS